MELSRFFAFHRRNCYLNTPNTFSSLPKGLGKREIILIAFRIHRESISNESSRNLGFNTFSAKAREYLLLYPFDGKSFSRKKYVLSITYTEDFSFHHEWNGEVQREGTNREVSDADMNIEKYRHRSQEIWAPFLTPLLTCVNELCCQTEKQPRHQSFIFLPFLLGI